MLSLDFDAVRKIFIRSTNWVGDAVMTTPAMGAVRASFPNAEISVCANPTVAELFRHHPHCDRVMVFDKKREHRGVGGLLRFSLGLRREGFDLAILFQNAVEAAIMVRAAGVPRRAGYSTDARGFLLTHAVPPGEAVRRLHHTRYYLHMLDALGIRGGDGRLRLHCTGEELAWARSTLGEGPHVAVNPGAAYGSAKRWLPRRFAAVGDALAEEIGARIVLIGGPGEAGTGNEIESAMTNRPLNLVGKTSVRQMMAVLADCSFMVTNDSGPMHVAAAFGVPLVAVFGSTDHTTTSPLTPFARIVRKEVDCAPCLLRRCPTDHRCMEAVTVEEVLEAARGLIQERYTHG